MQKEFLIAYLELAKSLRLPIIIHCRDAFEDLFTVFDEHYQNMPFILHCFTGSSEEAKEVVRRGGFVSLSGILTFKKSVDLQATAKLVPLENLLIETDAPYLAPQSKRGRTNEPSFIVETAAFLANLHGISLKEIGAITSQNSLRILKR